jgi:hypothetical protein
MRDAELFGRRGERFPLGGTLGLVTRGNRRRLFLPGGVKAE